MVYDPIKVTENKTKQANKQTNKQKINLDLSYCQKKIKLHFII